jgi:hypothetical protein
VLAGREVPRDAAERIQFALVCCAKALHGDASRQFQLAFSEDASLATADNRYNAACAAVLTAIQDADRAQGWRGVGLRWLRANLADSERQAREAANQVATTLEHWKQDRDLASVRDRIDELPEAERADWRKLWADVDAALAQAKAAPR